MILHTYLRPTRHYLSTPTSTHNYQRRWTLIIPLRMTNSITPYTPSQILLQALPVARISNSNTAHHLYYNAYMPVYAPFGVPRRAPIGGR